MQQQGFWWACPLAVYFLSGLRIPRRISGFLEAATQPFQPIGWETGIELNLRDFL
jgi:hypothetical protein